CPRQSPRAMTPPRRHIRRYIRRYCRLRALAAAIAAAALTGACGLEGTNFSQYHSLGPEGWRYGDTLAYCVRIADNSGYGEAPDTIDTGTLSVALRHDGSYPYAAIDIEVTYPRQGRLRRDTVRIPLADSYGRWTGCGFGDSYQAEATVTPRLTLTDSSMVTVRHVVRADTLRGISRVGVFFERTPLSER
ncbi:MAG: gliding motility lipoprotein GldH, partial [Candidatus Amulumruptor caecigallinarius]|nr:gliding motility lipoprotein GldH [Candidatus Amulumruptor caecigallinarius]